VGVVVAHIFGAQARVLQRQGQGSGALHRLGIGSREVIGVAAGPVACGYGTDIRLPGPGPFVILQDEDARAFAYDKTVPGQIEGSGSLGRPVVVSRGKGFELAEARHGEQRDRRLGAAGDHHIQTPRAQQIDGLADGVGARGAGRDLGEGRAMDFKPHGDVARGFVGDHKRHCHRRQSVRTRLHQLGVGFLKDIDTADAVTQADADPLGPIPEVQGAFGVFPKPCVPPGLHRGRDRVLGEQSHLAGFPFVHPQRGIEVFHLRGDSALQRGGVEMCHCPDARFALEKGVPKTVDIVAQRAYEPEARYRDFSFHVITPVELTSV